MLGVGGWLGYNAYQLKLETENAGEELFFVDPSGPYFVAWYSETYLTDSTVTEQGNQVQILNSSNEVVYSFDKSLYSGDKSEFNKKCDALKVRTGETPTDPISIYGINCL